MPFQQGLTLNTQCSAVEVETSGTTLHSHRSASYGEKLVRTINHPPGSNCSFLKDHWRYPQKELNKVTVKAIFFPRALAPFHKATAMQKQFKVHLFCQDKWKLDCCIGPLVLPSNQMPLPVPLDKLDDMVVYTCEPVHINDAALAEPVLLLA